MQILFSVFAIYASGRNNKTLDNLLTFAILIFFIFIDYYRSGYGVDEPSYANTFIDFKKNVDSFPYDFSFYALYYFIDIIAIPNEYFNKTIGCIYLIILYLSILRVTDGNYRAIHFILIAFSYVSLDFIFNAYRQGFSFLFLYISIYEFFNKRYIKGGILATISAGFHWSSLIVVAMYFTSKFIKDKHAYYLILLTIPFIAVSMFFPLGILKYSGMLISFLPFGESFSTHLNAYLDISNVQSSSIYALNVFGRIPLASAVIGCLSFILIFYNKINDRRIIPLIALLSTYGLLFMEMAYSFRNFYWMLPFFSLVMINYCHSATGNIREKRIAFVLLVQLVIAMPTFYTSRINAMIYDIIV